MEQLWVEGGATLKGRVRLMGAKNSILPLLAASVLCKGRCVFRSAPDLSDVRLAMRILGALGIPSDFSDGTVTTDGALSDRWEIPKNLMSGMRSSFMFLGPILARHGKAVVHSPGGCKLGLRPVDIHLNALGAMGARFDESGGCLRAELPDGRFHGATVELRYPSVGATENVLAAAATASGTTTVIGAAREPEIVDLARFLNRCGARIRGAGESVVTVEGVEALSSCEHTVIPDRILAATLIAAAAATRSEILIDNIQTPMLGALADIYSELGVSLVQSGNGIRVGAGERPRAIPRVVCAPFPSFPTDAGPMLAAALCFANGSSEIYDSVFENRFSFAAQFRAMGAKTRVLGRSLYIEGGERVPGGNVVAEDLRGGAALICLALASERGACLTGVEHIDRGYDKIENIFGALGAKIERRQISAD